MSFSIQTKILVQRVNKKNLMWSCGKKSLHGRKTPQTEGLTESVVSKFAMANNANTLLPMSCLCTVAFVSDL